MQTPYQVEPLPKQSFLQRILKVQPRSNAVLEVKNLFASKPVLQIEPAEINGIFARYAKKNTGFFRLEMNKVYSEFLELFVSDNKLTDEELSELLHVKHLLGINDSKAQSLFESVVGKIYRSEFDRALEDGRIDASETERLEKLRAELKLSDELAERIDLEAKKNKITNFMVNAILDERLSDDEMDEYAALCKNLNISPTIDSATKAVLDKYRRYWFIENREIPTIDAPIALQKGELCYYSSHCTYSEMKSVTQKINYSGFTYKTQITKGLAYRAGSIKPQRVTSEQLVKVDSGILYLTNKRIIFVGIMKNTSIRLERVLSITPYTNGVEIVKDSGKSPVFTLATDPELFSMIFTRIV